ncbi:MAG: DHH family phosphoesterase [Mycoplasma sp.]|nr:DHH family phosphoesterase [Mycoplasma sp.]
MQNKLSKIEIILSFVAFSLICAAIVLVSLYADKEHKVILLFGIVSIMVAVVILMYFINRTLKEERMIIKKSYQYYVENMVARSGIGIVVFDSNENIIWLSDFLVRRGFRNMIGRNIKDISAKIQDLISTVKDKITIKKGKFFYEMEIFYSKQMLLIKDKTSQELSSRFYKNERMAFGELEIDNFQQLESYLTSEELFKIHQIVIKHLDRLSANSQFVYKQYTNSKFFIITTSETFDKLKESKFKFINSIRKSAVKENLRLTISLGFGLDTSVLSELQKYGREALSVAQSRGGDQVAIISKTAPPEYFGGSVEAIPIRSTVGLRVLAENLVKKLESSSIKRVIIHGHRNADLDAIGSALGIYAIARTFKKEAYIANMTYDDSTKLAIHNLIPNNIKDELFIKKNKAKKLTDDSAITVIVDVNNHYLLEAIDAIRQSKNDNLFLFDHHRQTNLDFPHDEKNVYIDTAASSASEIVTNFLDFIKNKINVSKYIAQFLLNGIYLDTNHFAKTTSASTFSAAAKLEKMGASSQAAINSLKVSEKDTKVIRKIVSTEEEVKKGIFLAVFDEDASDVVVSKAADAMLQTYGRRASFVIAKIPNTKSYKMSARSIDLNIQVIAEKLGGGGHFSAAAVKTEENIEIFRENVIQAIVSVENESNIN